jgi:signal transduction histidine kinase
MQCETTSSKPAKPARVLLADDDQFFRVLLRKNVVRWGYDTVAVSDGEEAWRTLSSSDGPCLAILDWIMPSMDGLEVCRRIRESSLSRYVYVILLTARTGSHELLQGLEAGVDDYVSKPVDFEQLRLRLKAGARIIESDERQQSSRHHAELVLDQVRRVSARLFRTQDEERQTIARILHENVAQVLSGVLMNLSVLTTNEDSDSGRRKMLMEACTRTGECVRELRAVSYMLHPPLLDDIGLVSALRAHADGIERQAGIRIQLNIPADFPRMDAAVELTLFRIAQEALSNVERHSGSNRAVVTLEQTAGEARLEVRDAGGGFAAGILDSRSIRPGASGVGILAMRERIEQRGGTLEIQSSPAGATIVARIPIR